MSDRPETAAKGGRSADFPMMNPVSSKVSRMAASASARVRRAAPPARARHSATSGRSSAATGAPTVSDVGLAHFKDCKNLKILTLTGTQVSDAGLAHLEDCKKLTQLTLGQTKVTAKGVEGLAKVLATCKITWDGGVIMPK